MEIFKNGGGGGGGVCVHAQLCLTLLLHGL